MQANQSPLSSMIHRHLSSLSTHRDQKEENQFYFCYSFKILDCSNIIVFRKKDNLLTKPNSLDGR